MEKTLKEKVFDIVVLILDGKPVESMELSRTIHGVIQALIEIGKVHTAQEIMDTYDYVKKNYAAAFKVI